MKVLLSIKPEYVEKIFTGEKKFEYRKAIFSKKNIKTVVIYSTMPVGRVVGEFEIGGILSAHPSEIWGKTKEFSGVNEGFYNQYFKDRDLGHAIQIRNIVVYNKSKKLSDVIASNYAPQSFCYLDS
ncbi:ASCH domain-containing protein [Mucilaginibacter psychrotolerans]|uniref:ASCH domain-containing protein n=1 Tax=Mucilaginibacter psychrotolerans TaxID=1524096 RepID=A0A4Y8SQY1_9SPHI|nr:ASCH domain-containing protein [Mucilaginibacter psychrotolerans]TFF40950.1 ASCH domain-containing protein [Mucilaginibacter psychrotolerans]